MRFLGLIFLMFVSFGFFAQNVTDAQGLKQGFWKKMDEKNPKQRVYEGTFKDGKPVGKFKYYYSFDSVKVIMDFRDGGKVAYAKWLHPNGKVESIGKYVGEEKRDSVWVFYDEYGYLLSKESYSKGKKNGLSIIYLPDGKIAEQKNYKMDLPDGPFKQFFDGKIVKGEGVYINGHLDGKVSYYFPNGVAVAQGYYKMGDKVGPWIYRSENGKVKEKELYIDGKLADQKKTDAFFAKTKINDETPKVKPAQAGGKEEKKVAAPKTKEQSKK